MRYATAAAFRQALEQRLQSEAQNTGTTLARLRKRVAFEAFLRRLLLAAPERWVLKGALALDFRLRTRTRSTKDIDLGRQDDEQAAIRDIAAAQQLALDDFFAFAAVRTSELDDADDFTAVRFHVTAQLGGRTFEQFRVDISFVDSIAYEPDTIRSMGLLGFAGIPALELPTIPITQHLAEKVHAYTRTYGEQQRRSTRPKDLVDMLLIEESIVIEASALTASLRSTFGERAKHPADATAGHLGWSLRKARPQCRHRGGSAGCLCARGGVPRPGARRHSRGTMEPSDPRMGAHRTVIARGLQALIMHVARWPSVFDRPGS